MLKDIEAFTCLMYGYSRQDEINTVRHIMLNKLVGGKEQITLDSKADLEKLSPCRDSLISHAKRVNYRLGHHKRAKDPIFWSPNPQENHAWILNEEGLLEPEWSEGPILPQSLIDIAEETENEVNNRERLVEFSGDILAD